MMKKTNLLWMMAILVVLLVSACGGQQAAPPQEIPQVAPTQAPQQVEVVPTQQSAPVQQLAPACPAATTCSAPEVESVDTEVKDTYCVEKIPYQNILVAPGTKFEVLEKPDEFKCQDSGTVVDGKMVITCTGKELWAYHLKLSNASCSGSALTTGTGQCQDGFGYDASQGCCAPLTGGDSSGSVTIKVNIGACPVPSNDP